MSGYIDADEALRMMRNSKQDNPCDTPNKGIWAIAHDCCISCVEAVHTADVVEVVRCKDCIKRNTPECAMRYECSRCGGQWSWESDYSYCSYGEKRDA